MEYRYWTKEEEDYLMENYGKIPVIKIAEHLNRNYSTVTGKANRMGLMKKNDIRNSKYIRWKLANEILNIVRQIKGLLLVSASENPYKK